jgi:flagellar hook-length control protein FliK
MHRAGSEPREVKESSAKSRTDGTPTKSDVDVKAESDQEATELGESSTDSSRQLVDWLATLMKSPAQGEPQEATQARSSATATGLGHPPGLEQAAAAIANVIQMPGATHKDGKLGPTKPAPLSAERAPGTDAKANKPAAPLLTRETASALESSRSALSGSPADSKAAAAAAAAAAATATATAATLAAPDTPPATKASAQRPGTADNSPSLTGLTSPAAALAAPTSLHATPSASASASAAAATAAADTFIQQDVRRPEFVPAFSARIATLVQEGVEHARVHLNPVDMGPVSLQLALDGQQVRVDMTAELAATRQVLEQALPTLAGALREAGFTLSGGGVAPPAEAANTGGQDARGSQGSQGEPQPQSSGNPTGLSGQASDGRRQAQGEPGQAALGTALGIAEGLTTEIHLDAEGTPRLAHGRGLVDTFA